MSQQTANRATVPAGNDPWNLVPDLKKAVETAGLIIPVSSSADRDALPAAVKKAGCVVARTDLPGVTEIYDGSKWWKHGGPMHARFTGSTVPDIPTTAPTWGPGGLTYDPSQSINGGFATAPSNDYLALPAGVYDVLWRFKMSTASTGATWGSISNASRSIEYSSVDVPSGGGAGTVIASSLYLPTAQNIRFVFYSPTTAGYTLTSYITVFRKA